MREKHQRHQPDQADENKLGTVERGTLFPFDDVQPFAGSHQPGWAQLRRVTEGRIAANKQAGEIKWPAAHPTPHRDMQRPRRSRSRRKIQ